MNYFEMFDLPLQLMVDQKALKQKYLQQSRATHPDYFTLQDEAAQEEALHQTATINQGYKILSNADETLRYVLQLKGILRDDTKDTLPPAFLMEMLELNETVADADGDPDKINAARATINAIESDLDSDIKPIFERFDDTSSADDLALLKTYYLKKKYIERLKEPLREKL